MSQPSKTVDQKTQGSIWYFTEYWQYFIIMFKLHNKLQQSTTCFIFQGRWSLINTLNPELTDVLGSLNFKSWNIFLINNNKFYEYYKVDIYQNTKYKWHSCTYTYNLKNYEHYQKDIFENFIAPQILILSTNLGKMLGKCWHLSNGTWVKPLIAEICTWTCCSNYL